MTRVAVIAHARQDARRRPARAAARARAARASTDLVLARGAEEPQRARSRSQRRSSAGAELIFVWGGDGMVQRCVDVARRQRRRRWRSSPPAPPTCSRRTSASRRTSRRRSRSASPGHGAGIDVGRINGERFAVMAGAGFDARMIARRRRRPEGPPRTRRLRLDGREEPAREAVRARRSRSTAHAGSTARRAASWSATSASCSAASRCSRTRTPTTACSSSASSPPTAPCSGCGTLARAAVGNASKSPARAHDRRRTRCASSSTARCRYELDGGDRKKVRKLRIEVEPGARRGLRAGLADGSSAG